MVTDLSDKNKISFIDGSILMPNDSSIAELQQWIRCNNMVKSWLLSSLSMDIHQNMIYNDLAYDIWAYLMERFLHVNNPHVFQIERSIYKLLQDTMYVVTYFTKLKGLWDELSDLCVILACSYGARKEIQQYQQRQKTMKFLMGLNDLYHVIRGQILLIDPLPSVNRAYSLAMAQVKTITRRQYPRRVRQRVEEPAEPSYAQDPEQAKQHEQL
ncbi:uncharacterized protein LOC132316701 [Cornus florida]|uniref:uncharacterized protein LOC132316701 n=1 Tax=Cornus florida TaxID=4283 RepID=UPI0028A13A26|nr:uncharacterized protein LOC132316701 [Cornus florida]